MAIIRNVIIEGAVYSRHEIASIEHNVSAGITHVAVESSGDYATITTYHAKDLDVGISLEDAYTWLKELPEFEEHVDPFEELAEELADILTDEQAATVPNAYKEWQPDTPYVTGDRRRYGEALYKCLQPHTSQEGWEPNQAPSLWARILNPDPEVIPVWQQPDSTNPYMTGDKVHYPDAEGPVYESTIDNNIWSPEAYPAGWQLVEEEA